jgi:ribosomal protein S18 acetylase RimI-like enzyme
MQARSGDRGAGNSAKARAFMEHVIVRIAKGTEFAAIGELRVTAYVAQGMLPTSPYAEVLRDLGVSTPGDVLVAHDDGRLVGTVMLEPFHPGSEIAAAPDEAEIRALTVAPHAQGRGTGTALVRAVIERATATGVRHLLLSTRPTMTAAQRLYQTAGFTRLPERDWSPAPDIPLLAYCLHLPVRRISAG